jgi:hypothetical protein
MVSVNPPHCYYHGRVLHTSMAKITVSCMQSWKKEVAFLTPPAKGLQSAMAFLAVVNDVGKQGYTNNQHVFVVSLVRVFVWR